MSDFDQTEMFDVPLDNDVIPVNQLLMDQTAR
jgi:hypothetical protein